MPPTKPRPWAPSRPKTLEEYRARKRLEAEREGIPAEDASASTSTPTSHPNICRMLDFFEDHEFYYLVMPCFGRGQDLFDYVESAPDGLAAFQCRSIFGQVADALWFLHANNIVHRDIKDENVILNGEGHAQLIDFGSAAHVRPGKLFDTFSGTLDYAAAEILQGEKYAGQAQDVWALGVVGFVLLCGECPFWNGEEAVQGVEEGTRAAQTLKERCMIARGGLRIQREATRTRMSTSPRWTQLGRLARIRKAPIRMEVDAWMTLSISSRAASSSIQSQGRRPSRSASIASCRICGLDRSSRMAASQGADCPVLHCRR